MTTLPRRPLRTFTLAASAATLAALALAAPASADEIAPAPLAEPGELHVLDRTNLARAAAGCAPLVLDQALTLAADRHTADMAASSTMSHEGTDGSSPRTRLAAAGSFPRIAAENVAHGYDAAGVVDAWLASPGHRANLLDCRLTTVGIAEQPSPQGSWWTQVLAG